MPRRTIKSLFRRRREAREKNQKDQPQHQQRPLHWRASRRSSMDESEDGSTALLLASVFPASLDLNGVAQNMDGVKAKQSEDFVQRSANRCCDKINRYVKRQGCSQVLTNSNFATDDSDRSSKQVVIPRVSKKDCNECAICWEEYKKGDTVLWSAQTTSCKHVFHQDCMTKFVTNHERRRRRLYSLSTSLTSADHEAYAQGEDDGYEHVKIEIPCPQCRCPFMSFSYDENIREL